MEMPDPAEVETLRKRVWAFAVNYKLHLGPPLMMAIRKYVEAASVLEGELLMSSETIERLTHENQQRH